MHCVCVINKISNTSMTMPESVNIDVDKLNTKYSTYKISSSVCIYKIPEVLRNTKENAYLPHLVGLGPYHHFEGNLPNLKAHKIEAVRRTLKRIRINSSFPEDAHAPFQVQELEGLRNEVLQIMPQIQGCYDEHFDFVPDLFILDACFLLEYCISLDEDEQSDNFHPVFDQKRLQSVLGHSMRRDFIKLENQIPLVLLRKLIELQCLEEEILVALISGVFIASGPVIKVRARQILRDEEHSPRHILQWLHMLTLQYIRGSYIGIDTNAADQNQGSGRSERALREDNTWSIPRAEALNTAGIYLRPADKLLFQEKYFKLKGVLGLPKLTMDDDTEVVLRNVMAYEECLGINKNWVTRFVALLDNLIDRESDVALLRKVGVIDNLLESDKEVARMINRLCIQVTQGEVPEIENNVTTKVRKYYRSSARVMLREFMELHFSRPWYFIGTVAAIIVLLCTIVQAIYAVKSYKP